jgi:NAD(P)-dependent dehydrogenase (short-subunit alcohol dehydrogenase family)
MNVAFITSANRGLGFEIAQQLGTLGMHVILRTRDPDKGRAALDTLSADGIQAECVGIDVSDSASIGAAPQAVAGKHEHFDVLVNNAGLLNDFGMTASELPLENLRASFETNFFGAFETTQNFPPLIRKAPAGRIVKLTSDLGSLTAMGDPKHPQFAAFAAGYQASKCALNVLTSQFAKELADTQIKVNSASPGLCRTDMGGEDAPLSVEQGAATAVWLATLDADGPTGRFYSSTLEGGEHPL